MRADRLVAILLTLQVRGRCTAGELAGELEVSPRTIRRDLDALCMAGVPLYSERGRGGGWTLVGGHRVDLTGLTATEAQALFLATGPGLATVFGPGVTAGLVAARRKVLAALPEPLRAGVAGADSALLVDQSAWAGPPSATDGMQADDMQADDTRADDTRADDTRALEALRSAVLAGRQVVVSYEPPGRPAEDRRLHPHGLVCKLGTWYLVATAPAGLRTYRVSRVRSVLVTDDPVEHPAGFDLAATWADVRRRLSTRATPELAVEVAVEPAWLGRLDAMVGAWWPVERLGTGDDGRTTARIRFASAAVAAAELVRLADHVEVLAPGTVRAEMAALGHRLVSRYGGPTGAT